MTYKGLMRGRSSSAEIKWPMELISGKQPNLDLITNNAIISLFEI